MKRKAKGKPKLKIKSKRHKHHKELKQIQVALQKLCPKAHPVSLFHLAIAVTRSFKYFLTGDPAILKQTKVIQKKYKLLICDNPDAAKEIPKEKEKSAFEFYL